MNINDVITPQQDPAGKLAEFAANLKFEDIPKEHVEYIKRDILDMMSSFIGGSTGPSVDTILSSIRSWGNQGSGNILIFGDSAPVPQAAFANGVMARAVDMGDTGVKGGHISEWVVPSLLTGLAVADRPISGKEFIKAFVAGAEWGAREHTTLRLQFNTNIMPGECAGSRYATVALAKMLGFDKEQIWNAAGMAFSAHPHHEQQKYAEGTPDARLQHGYVVSHAIQITDLVKRGLSSIHGIYMGHGGLLKNVNHGDMESPDFLTNELGTRWVWKEGITMKMYAGCYYNHTPIYGVLGLMKEHNFTRREIEKIHFVTSFGCTNTTEPVEVKKNPKTPEAAMFSNFYAVTHAVFTGDCFLEAFKEDTFKRNMSNPEFIDFINKMSYEVDPEITSPFDNYHITITLKDGREFSKVEDQLPGNVANPMTWDQVINKFWKSTEYSAVDLGKEKYQKIIDLCKNLDNLEDMRDLFNALIPDKILVRK